MSRIVCRCRSYVTTHVDLLRRAIRLYICESCHTYVESWHTYVESYHASVESFHAYVESCRAYVESCDVCSGDKGVMLQHMVTWHDLSSNEEKSSLYAHQRIMCCQRRSTCVVTWLLHLGQHVLWHDSYICRHCETWLNICVTRLKICVTWPTHVQQKRSSEEVSMCCDMTPLYTDHAWGDMPLNKRDMTQHIHDTTHTHVQTKCFVRRGQHVLWHDSFIYRPCTTWLNLCVTWLTHVQTKCSSEKVNITIVTCLNTCVTWLNICMTWLTHVQTKCSSEEVNITIVGTAGAMCSPVCGLMDSCPQDVPDDVTVYIHTYIHVQSCVRCVRLCVHSWTRALKTCEMMSWYRHMAVYK